MTDVDPGDDGIFGNGDDSVTFLRTKPDCPDVFCMDDPEDVAWDPVSGQVFIAGGTEKTMTSVSPGANGVFDGIPSDGDDVLGTTYDLSAFSDNVEGMEYRASSDTLLIVDPNKDTIFEITKDGRLIREIDISVLKLPSIPLKPSDVTLAPPSEGGGPLNLYVTDRVFDNNINTPMPDRDGKMYEMSVPFDNLAPFVDAGPNKTIAIADPLTITGDSYDDGQPTLDPLDLTWTQVDGPPGGIATFGSPNSLSTTVSFSEVGGSADPYLLELKSDDGSLFSVDTMQVEVFADPPVNQPPTVFAGSNQTVVLPNVAILAGAASDDGLPNPPNVVTTTWSKVSGPGSVTFGNISTLDTTASFSTDGVYVLRLTADDSALQSTDDVIVTVNAEPPPPPPGKHIYRR